MASKAFAKFLQKNSWRLTTILVYAVLEWILIFLLLVSALFQFIITKFASFFGLQPPCLWCTRIDHLIEPKDPDFHKKLICERHAKEISLLSYCTSHKRLAESHGMCDDCAFSGVAEETEEKDSNVEESSQRKLCEQKIWVVDNQSTACTAPTKITYGDEESMHDFCSCCKVVLNDENKMTTQSLLQTIFMKGRPGWSALEYSDVEEDESSEDALKRKGRHLRIAEIYVGSSSSDDGECCSKALLDDEEITSNSDHDDDVSEKDSEKIDEDDDDDEDEDDSDYDPNVVSDEEEEESTESSSSSSDSSSCVSEDEVENRDFVQEGNQDFIEEKNRDFIEEDKKDFVEEKKRDFIEEENKDFIEKCVDGVEHLPMRGEESLDRGIDLALQFVDKSVTANEFVSTREFALPEEGFVSEIHSLEVESPHKESSPLEANHIVQEESAFIEKDHDVKGKNIEPLFVEEDHDHVVDERKDEGVDDSLDSSKGVPSNGDGGLINEALVDSEIVDLVEDGESAIEEKPIVELSEDCVKEREVELEELSEVCENEDTVVVADGNDSVEVVERELEASKEELFEVSNEEESLITDNDHVPCEDSIAEKEVDREESLITDDEDVHCEDSIEEKEVDVGEEDVRDVCIEERAGEEKVSENLRDVSIEEREVVTGEEGVSDDVSNVHNNESPEKEEAIADHVHLHAAAAVAEAEKEGESDDVNDVHNNESSEKEEAIAKGSTAAMAEADEVKDIVECQGNVNDEPVAKENHAEERLPEHSERRFPEGDLYQENNGEKIDKEEALEHPSSMECMQFVPRRLLIDRRESGMEGLDRRDSVVDSLDGSVISDMDAEVAVDKLKKALDTERKTLNSLYSELEEERNAAAIAANQTMAMITRLQEEKAAVQMEALQYQRMMEEQSEYDQEALQLLNEILVKREREKQELEKELEKYRKKIMRYQSKERRRREKRSEQESESGGFGDSGEENSAHIRTPDNQSRRARTSSSSSLSENSGDVFSDGGEDALDLDLIDQNTPADAIINASRGYENGEQKNSLDDSLADYEEERLAILEQLKSLEEKLHKLAEDDQNVLSHADSNGIDEHSLQDIVEEEANGKFDEVAHEEASGKMDEAEGNGNGVALKDSRVAGLKSKRLLPLFDAAAAAQPDSPRQLARADPSNEWKSVKAIVRDNTKLAIEEEVYHVYERLQALEADREFLKHTIKSLRKGDEGMKLLQEIVQHLRDLRRVEQKARDMEEDM